MHFVPQTDTPLWPNTIRPTCLLLGLSAAWFVALLLRSFRFVHLLTNQREACFAALRESIDSKTSLSLLSTQKRISKVGSATRALPSPHVTSCYLTETNFSFVNCKNFTATSLIMAAANNVFNMWNAVMDAYKIYE